MRPQAAARPRRATLNGNIMMLALALACFDRFKKFEIILAICSYGAIHEHMEFEWDEARRKTDQTSKSTV